LDVKTLEKTASLTVRNGDGTNCMKRSPFEHLIVAKLDEEFSVFDGIRKLDTVSTKPHHWTLP